MADTEQNRQDAGEQAQPAEMYDYKGKPVPRDIFDEIVQDTSSQVAGTIRRKAQSAVGDILGEEFNFKNANPMDIIRALASKVQEKDEAVHEVKGQTAKATDEKDLEIQRLKKALRETESKYAGELKQFQQNTVKTRAVDNIKSHLLRLRLKPENEPIAEAMISQYYEADVEGDGVVWRERGSDRDLMINGKLATAQDIAEMLVEKFPSNFDRIAKGAGTRGTSRAGAPGKDLHELSTKQLLEQAWS